MIIDRPMPEAFKEIKEDVEDRIACGAAIYGTDHRVFTITDELGYKPSELLFERGSSTVINYGDRRDVPVTYYSLKTNKIGVIKFCLGAASRDDLNMFICMADPDMLSISGVQKAFFDRLKEIQAEDQAAQIGSPEANAAEVAQFKEYMGYMENTQYKDRDIFLHSSYSEDKQYPELFKYKQAKEEERKLIAAGFTLGRDQNPAQPEEALSEESTQVDTPQPSIDPVQVGGDPQPKTETMSPSDSGLKPYVESAQLPEEQ